jgi:putative transposase
MLRQANFIRHIGKENILPHVKAALDRAQEISTSFEGIGKEVASEMQRSAL